MFKGSVGGAVIGVVSRKLRLAERIAHDHCAQRVGLCERHRCDGTTTGHRHGRRELVEIFAELHLAEVDVHLRGEAHARISAASLSRRWAMAWPTEASASSLFMVPSSLRNTKRIERLFLPSPICLPRKVVT